MRGNPERLKTDFGLKRSIPACAGEPGALETRLVWLGVYPRACGGTMRCGVCRTVQRGLSPRVRGNRRPARHNVKPAESIPARAGEPFRRRRPADRSKVYPRACGGTAWELQPISPACGLSPRVRGNRSGGGARQTAARSIPARAGEPHGSFSRYHQHVVYPRACGGTV